jgi:hypothetical protein
MSLLPITDPGRQPVSSRPASGPPAGPADLPTAAQHARFADDGRDVLADALKATRLVDAFKQSRATDAQLRRVVSRIAAVARADVGALTRRLIDGLGSGLATLGGWSRSMLGVLVPAHYAAAFARLGSPTPPPADLKVIRDLSDAQSAFLARFRRNLASGLQRLDGTAEARAKLYGSAVWGLAEDAYREEMARDGFAEEMRVRAAKDSCLTCIKYAGYWAPINTLPRIGDSYCLANCQCHFTYR